MVESKEKIPHRKRTMVVNLRKYLEVTNSGELQTELVRIEDGIAITRYKGE
jgi:predicted O-methyltransferase YrrM